MYVPSCPCTLIHHAPKCMSCHKAIVVISVRKHLRAFICKYFVGHFEKNYFYFRSIDDIFSIWTGSKNVLIKFLNELNTKHSTIKFEFEISKYLKEK